MSRSFCVFLELHGVGSATLGSGTQVGGITEHLSQRHFSTYFLTAGTVVVHTQYETTATVQVAHYIAHVVFRSFYFHSHNRLQQYRRGFTHTVFECHRSGQFKRNLRRVHIVVRTESQADANIYHRITGYDTILQSVADTFMHRRDEFARNHTTFNFIDKFIACTTRLHRFHFDHNVTILTFTARLFNVFSFGFHFFVDGFAVGHLRYTHISVHTELTLHAVHDNFQVQLAHTGNNGLARFFISAHTERRVFFSQTVQSDTHFLLVGLSFRLNGNVDYRLGEFHAFKDNRGIFCTQSFTVVTSFKPIAAAMSPARTSSISVRSAAVIYTKRADTLTSAFNRVQNSVARFRHARVNTDKGQLTNVFIIQHLESQSGEFLVITGLAAVGFFSIRVNTLNWRNVGRSRQQFNHGIQHTLNTFVFKCRTAQHRLDFTGKRTLTQRASDFFFRQLFTTQVLVHQLFAGFGGGFDHILTPLFGSRNQISRDIVIFESYAFIGFIPNNGFHLQQVHYAFEFTLGTNRNHDWHGIGAQTGFHLLNYAEEVGTLTVHFVYKCQARNLVFIGLAPHSFRQRQNTTYCTV
uniref:Uncharacterized 66.3 kDa protein in hag2 5'region n=1 Tax=Eikenella corrodens TaxID=539 RepID=YHA2_EIKCO|nr:RecName: Full=Uncharacterized 66.3 kDa protein in hag2 5'region [Eikenella corrodens]CAA78253.1 hypothetical 66.3 KD protein in HAG2 5'region [Eikenella corrodens]